MTSPPEVSVILPTYQRRRLVKEAVESVLSQTFEDFELLVVDDGSTDGTQEALWGLDARLRYLRQENAGVSAARNLALAQARGSILAFLDSDDRWRRDHLAVVVEVLRRWPSAVLVTTSPRHLIGGRAHPDAAWLHEPLPVQLFANPVGYPSCIAVRRQAVQEAGGFDERLQVGEDGDLVLRLALQGSFAMLQRRTLIKRYTPGLREWGRANGHYLDSFEYRVRRIRDIVAADPDAHPSALLGQADGALAFFAALRALDDGDDEAVAAWLQEGCKLLPELSSEAEVVEERLDFLRGAHNRVERLRHLGTLARLWPDPLSDTALFLRACGAGAALRAGRLQEAFVLLRHWPLRATPSFLRWSLPSLGRRLRRHLHARRHRFADGVDLDKRPASIGLQPPT